MSDHGELVKLLLDFKFRIAELEHKQANMVRVGTVSKADGKQGYQVNFGNDDDGQPIPSAWFPHPEEGGKLKTWRPMSEGQIVYAICPNGDQQQGFLVPKGGFSDENKQPSEKLDENVETFGKFKTTLTEQGFVMSWGDKNSITFNEAGVTEKIGDHTRTTTKDGTKFEAGRLDHDGRNIGKNHVHAGVEPGSGKTGDPDA